MSRLLASYVSPGSGEQLGWGAALSFGLHLLLVAAVLFWPGFGSSRRQIFAPVYRVNLVGAPNLPPGPPAAAPPKANPASAPAKTPPAQKAPAKKAVEPPPKKAEAIGAKKKEEDLARKKAELARQKQELEKKKAERLKREKRKQDLAESRALEKRLARLKSQVSQEKRLEGRLNQLEAKMADRAASGAFAPAAGRGGGGGGSQASMRFQVYYTRLWEQVRSKWVLSEARVADARGLMAVVVITLLKDGSLQKAQLEKSSGNRAFDESCLGAVEKAAPYPPFPAGLKDRRMEVGVRFRADDMNPG